jgi:hypothetical protein
MPNENRQHCWGGDKIRGFRPSALHFHAVPFFFRPEVVDHGTVLGFNG